MLFIKKEYMSLVFIFLLVLFVSFKIPMHSDDFAYSLRGIGFNSIIEHYRGWSGRLVSDFISTFLLTILPKSIYGLINSLALTGLIYFICLIPVCASGKRQGLAVCIVIVFFLYFVANPSLGQTSFWIVGSANYLWTNLFISAYFSLLFSCLRKSSINIFYYINLLVLGLLAGCSNENTALIVIILSIIIFFIEDKRKLILVGFFGNAVGAAALLFSPGNFARVSTVQEWVNTPFKIKLFTHFSERFPDAMSSYWQLYMVFIFLLLAITIYGAGNKKQIIYSMIFLLASIASNAAFVLSPSMPERSWNGAFCLLLIALAFVYHEYAQKSGNIFVRVRYFILTVLVLYFIPSYILFYQSVYVINEETNVRDSLIRNAIKEGRKEVSIPDLYFPTIFKRGPSLDTFNSNMMPQYYGINKVNVFSPGFFDYSQIFRANKIPVNLRLGFDLYITNVYLYKESLGIKNYIIYEFNKQLNEAIPKNFNVFIHLRNKAGSEFIADLTSRELCEIDGHYISGRESGYITQQNILSISAGLYDSVDGHRITEDEEFVKLK